MKEEITVSCDARYFDDGDVLSIEGKEFIIKSHTVNTIKIVECRWYHILFYRISPMWHKRKEIMRGIIRD